VEKRDPRDMHRMPQRHAPQDDRTGEFVLIADRPMHNSDGSRSSLPREFGGDQRPVGHIEFASFEMLAMAGHRSGPGAYATRPGEVADFRVGAPSGAQFGARPYS
jgi:hypothetical protein